MLRFAARLIANECTVRLSGLNCSISDNVCSTSAISSPGSPTIISMLMFVNPASRAIAYACLVCSTLCALPISSSVASDIVCGLILMRSTPSLRSTSNLSIVILSGLPHSTQNSFTYCISNVCCKCITSSSN